MNYDDDDDNDDDEEEEDRKKIVRLWIINSGSPKEINRKITNEKQQIRNAEAINNLITFWFL